MKRRDFLKTAAAGTLALSCGRYLPDPNVMEVAAVDIQNRASLTSINKLFWQAADNVMARHPGLKIQDASAAINANQELMIRVMEGHPPDTLNFTTAETGLIYSYIDQGHVMDITEYMNGPSEDTPGVSWVDTIDPIYHQPLMYKGRFYASPVNVISLQIYYNVELYEKAGATQSPRTWDEMMENCERLKRIGVHPFTQDGIHWYTSWWFDHLSQRIVGSEKVRQAFRDPQRSVPWTEDGFLRAARMIGEMLDRGYFVEGFSGLADAESEALFWRKEAASVFVGTWFTSSRREMIGEDFHMRCFRFPELPGAHGDYYDLIGTVNSISIPTKSRHKEEAAEFLRQVSSRWFQTAMVEEVRRVSPLKNMPMSAAQQGLEVIISETKHFYPFSYGLEGSDPLLYRQYWNEWNRFMVARELTAEQYVENLEKIFRNYYQHA